MLMQRSSKGSGERGAGATLKCLKEEIAAVYWDLEGSLPKRS